jgi:hypothetical protein
MQDITRKAGVALAALTVALTVAMAGQAQAATTTVRLHTQLTTTKSLGELGNLTQLQKTNAIDDAQRWIRTDTSGGFATFRNVKSRRCLTGRGLQGFPVVTVEPCTSGTTRQQWRLGPTGDLQLRLNNLVAEPDATFVLKMAVPRFLPQHRWHTHPA